MEFKCRKIIESSDQSAGSTNETVWAYTLKTSKEAKSGRYRIRISRYSREQIAAFAGGDVDSLPEGFDYGLQASLDHFDFSNGWIPLLDWMGNPESTDKEIQRDLNEQIQAFLTGVPTTKQKWMNDFEDGDEEVVSAATKAAERKKEKIEEKIKEPPKVSFTQKVDEPNSVSEESSEDEDSEDDDWI
jgi:hypothetical protein